MCLYLSTGKVEKKQYEHMKTDTQTHINVMKNLRDCKDGSALESTLADLSENLGSVRSTSTVRNRPSL